MTDLISKNTADTATDKLIERDTEIERLSAIIKNLVSQNEQNKLERDICLEQLAAIGKRLGDKMDDVAIVVRCKDCKFNALNPKAGNTLCKQGVTLYQRVDFCSLGERREDEHIN